MTKIIEPIEAEPLRYHPQMERTRSNREILTAIFAAVLAAHVIVISGIVWLTFSEGPTRDRVVSYICEEVLP